ncbi:MAG: hypothetical protein K2K38_05500 [Clostridia bacterium]|nr:hypothetical protein [Clostridia bacterium]
MRFKKMFAVLFGCMMLMPLAAFAACNQSEDDYPLDGFDLDDTRTWFDEEKTDLPTLKQCKKVTVGMSLTEVIRKIGKPQRDIAYGAIIFQFDIDDGSAFTVWFDSELCVQSVSFDQERPAEYIYLNEQYPWINELKVENIEQVRYEFSYTCVVPGTFKDIYYSTNSVDIENSYKVLFSSLPLLSRFEITDGGSYVKYDFKTSDDKTYSVTIYDQMWFNGQYYSSFEKTYKLKFSDLDCHSFITYPPYDDQYEVYAYGDEGVKIGEYDGLGEFEFQLIEGEIDKTPGYRLKCFEEDLLILSEDYFMIELEEKSYLFKITGDKSFSFLFNLQ